MVSYMVGFREKNILQKGGSEGFGCRSVANVEGLKTLKGAGIQRKLDLQTSLEDIVMWGESLPFNPFSQRNGQNINGPLLQRP